MPHGQLNEAQRELLKSFVDGKEVYDLGSGDLGLAIELVDLGASKVIAIDKENRYQSFRDIPPEIEMRSQYFSEVYDDIDIAFVSWPANYDNSLLQILKKSKTILYVGKNTDGTACGTPELFRYLVTRKAIQIPDRRNVLICYTEFLIEPREWFQEERAAIEMNLGIDVVHYSEG
jgi:hypothetical protein